MSFLNPSRRAPASSRQMLTMSRWIVARELAASCFGSTALLLASLLLLEGIFWDNFNMGVITLIGSGFDFFSSDSGKRAGAPIIMLFGAIFGYFASGPPRHALFFWVDFILYLIAGAVLLFILVCMAAPDERGVGGALEQAGIDPQSNPIVTLLSLILAALSAWLTSRYQAWQKSRRIVKDVSD